MVRGGIGAGLQAVADFLVDERCHACHRLVSASAGLSLPHDRASAALAAPVRIGPARFGIDTHPLCRACCHTLTPATEPIPIDTLTVWPAFITDDSILSVIHALKFSRHERLARWLARALASGLPERALSPESMLVPIPAHRASLRRRGFNQAERLASAFASFTSTKIERRALVKTRATAPQSMLDRTARMHNVAGAMTVVAREGVAGGRVVVVDDLVTTGATAAACASALWKAGAAEVRVVCVGYRP